MMVFVKCPTKIRVWRDKCPAKQEKLFLALKSLRTQKSIPSKDDVHIFRFFPYDGDINH